MIQDSWYAIKQKSQTRSKTTLSVECKYSWIWLEYNLTEEED